MNVKRYNTTPQKLESVELFIKEWRPIEGWLIQDDNGSFVLPTHHSTLGNSFFKSYKNSVKKSFILLLFTMLLVSFVFLFRDITQPTAHITLFVMLLSIALMDMGLSTKSIDNCKQKVEFLFELKKSFPSVLLTFAPFLIFIILTQFYLSRLLGDFETLVISFGNYYPEIGISSLWRFLLGPLFHSDIQHWLVNTILTILIASMVPMRKTLLTFYVFYVGAVGSHVVTFSVNHFYHTPFDALLGLSGGAYTLLAYAISYYYEKKYFNIIISLLSILAFSELSLSILSNDASHSAHLSGFLIGIFIYKLKGNSCLTTLTKK
ncbi:rhomboid family intramembrane serine protease [Psychrobium sp. 1_MG-2023]|uniref:rhomboid family intramembrane serine protease n=1 Tax=Psychrobium sp. 1_MG-2023 TaxID=3062624 RepID=UPI000C32CD20|nr:rhomboid family intramembrane serine protease [Psychrobium sp. 1_MG-2023]MDP2562167.1 rhomboid family intramembrane serine protease [Psychrobium sp. 1_MG-2023]PKF57162.1 hypothetical protein CW748_07155 [Alteromonadales bacterium alter-6D02]